MKNLWQKMSPELRIRIGISLFIIGLGFTSNKPFYFWGYMLPLLLLYFLQVFILIPSFFQTKKRLQYGSLLILVNCLTFLSIIGISFYYFSQHVKDISYWEILKSPYPFHPLTKEALFSILAVFLLSIIYLSIKHLYKKGYQALLKRISIYTAYLFLGCCCLYGTTYLLDTNWAGTEDIHFIADEAYHSLSDLQKDPRFKDQLIYVDLWYSSCGPCRFEFKKLARIKDELTELGIQFVYLAHETTRPHDRQLWKNAIKKYDLTGWHYYMTEEFEQDIWNQISEKTQIKARYPHYLIMDKKGEVIFWDASRPSEKGELKREIGGL